MTEVLVLKEIVGKTPVIVRGMETNSDLVEFIFSDGTYCSFYHSQECCETVEVEEVIGDYQDLIGSPLLVAEEVTEKGEKYSSSWTFYKFATIKGSVDVRWLGWSNGFYSEDVDFHYNPERQSFTEMF